MCKQQRLVTDRTIIIQDTIEDVRLRKTPVDVATIILESMNIFGGFDDNGYTGFDYDQQHWIEIRS